MVLPVTGHLEEFLEYAKTILEHLMSLRMAVVVVVARTAEIPTIQEE
jgi:hypothetical protein